jgi:hypothetical protein
VHRIRRGQNERKIVKEVEKIKLGGQLHGKGNKRMTIKRRKAGAIQW